MSFVKNVIGKRLIIKNLKLLNMFQKDHNQKMLTDGEYQVTYGYALRKLAIKRCVFVNNFYAGIFDLGNNYVISEV